MKGIEDVLKLPAGITSRQMVPELLARIVEFPIDVIMNDITAAKIAKGILGALFMTAPQYIGPALSREWKDRDTEDVYAMAKEWLVEMTDPTADDMVKIANAVQNLRQGFAFGDSRRIFGVFGVKSLGQIQNDWANVARAFASAFGIPAATPPGKPANGATVKLYRETLGPSGPSASSPAESTPIPGIPKIFRATLDHGQPPPLAGKKYYRETLS